LASACFEGNFLLVPRLQGDQIGRIFTFRPIVFLGGHFLITEATQLFGLRQNVWINIEKNGVGYILDNFREKSIFLRYENALAYCSVTHLLVIVVFQCSRFLPKYIFCPALTLKLRLYRKTTGNSSHDFLVHF
jgi:hypothetical protein